MERIVKRKCICCGNEYEYCYHCGDKKKDSWKNNYDVESCRDVFNIITDYRGGYMTKEEATERLKELNLMNRATYIKDVADFVDELLKTPEKKEKTDFIKEDKPVIENTDNETVDSILSHNKIMFKKQKTEKRSFD